MTRYGYIFALTLLLIIPFRSYGQQELTLSRCREMALEHNKQMEIADANKEKAAYDVKAYKANYLPKITATGNYLYTSAKMKKTIAGGYLPTFVPDGSGGLVPNILTTVDGNPIFKEYAYFPDMDIELKLSGTYTAGVKAEQPIFMGGKVTAAYRMSKIGEQIAGMNRELTEDEVILKTDEAYWTHVKTEELYRTALKYRDLVAELQRNVDNAVKVGMKPRNDALKVTVKLNEAELQVLQADNAVRLSRMNLCHVIGLPLTSQVTVPASSDIPDVSVVRGDDISARPEYSMLAKQVELYEQQTRLARSEFMPNLGVMANYGYANGLKLNGSRLLDKWAFSAVVSLNVPIFYWGEGRNKVRSAESDKRIAALQRDDATEKMELELSRAINTYHEAVVEDELTTRSLSQAEENLKVSRDFYDVGMETLANLLEAQTLWQQAWAEQVRAKTSLRLSETQYLKAIGEL